MILLDVLSDWWAELVGMQLPLLVIIYFSGVAICYFLKLGSCNESGKRRSKTFLETLCPKKVIFSRSVYMEFSHLILNAFFSATFSILIININELTHITPLVSKKLTSTFGISSITAPNGLNAAFMSLMAVTIAYDIGFFSCHYIFHKVPFLWEFHKVHHSAPNLFPTTGFRFHIFELLMHKLFIGTSVNIIAGFCCYLLGTPDGNLNSWIFITASLIYYLPQTLQHSNIWWSWGPFDYVFCSPAMHHIHHSNDILHRDKNFANFPIFDILIGTFYKPSKEFEKISYGINDDFKWSSASFLQFVMHPLRRSFAIITSYISFGSRWRI
jgi:sterol desaturase/sphingolipid hydroxylase (fatty acid hydroxylase superfamily)